VPHSSPCLTTLANVHPCEGASSSQFMAVHRLAAVVRRFFHRVFTLTTGDWDSSNQAFTMSAGSNATCGTASSHSYALLPACSCPVDLSIAGKLVAQTPPSSVSRLHRGYDDAPHGAHCAGTSQLTQLPLSSRRAARPAASAKTAAARVSQRAPTTASSVGHGRATVCISVWPIERDTRSCV
jgi:hypothetical protein